MRLLLQLAVIAIVAMLQVWSITTIGAALKAPSVGSMMMDEEETDDDTLVEHHELIVFTAPEIERLTYEAQPPAPVHLEPDGKPPSA